MFYIFLMKNECCSSLTFSHVIKTVPALPDRWRDVKNTSVFCVTFVQIIIILQRTKFLTAIKYNVSRYFSNIIFNRITSPGDFRKINLLYLRFISLILRVCLSVYSIVQKVTLGYPRPS